VLMADGLGFSEVLSRFFLEGREEMAWHTIDGHVTFIKCHSVGKVFGLGGSWLGMCGAVWSVAFNIYGRKEVLTSCLFSISMISLNKVKRRHPGRTLSRR